ncbi:MAG: hypothetical protein KGJ77_03250 [Acidobacteriota bacterium]|nr:hypothetical protein [Acidobacteriota bacterium]
MSRDVDAREEPEQRPSRRAVARAAVLLVLAGAVVAFVVGNTQKVPVHLGVTTAHPQLVWTVVGSLAVGIVLGFVGGRGVRGRKAVGGRGRRGR